MRALAVLSRLALLGLALHGCNDPAPAPAPEQPRRPRWVDTARCGEPVACAALTTVDRDQSPCAARGEACRNPGFPRAIFCASRPDGCLRWRMMPAPQRHSDQPAAH